MKLTSIKLRGAIGILKGIGVEEVHLNLSNLNGMVALDGDNGKGKTTLLDNMHPYRVLPSRPKKSLQHHFYLRDSFREIELEHNGRQYRFLIKIDPEAGKQEGYIYVDGSSESITTGKVREYDDIVTSLFGSLDLFVSSVFCAQKTDDSKMTVGKMKEQWAEFLKLHELQGHAETAKRASTIILGHIATTSREIEHREKIMDQLLFVPVELGKVRKEADHNALRLNALEDHLVVLDRDLQAAMEAEAKDTAKRKQIEAIGDRIGAIEKEIDESERGHETALKDKTNQVDDVSARLDSLKTTINNADQIKTAAGEVEAIDKKFAGLYDQKANKEKLLADAKAELAALDAECRRQDTVYELLFSKFNRKQDRIKTHLKTLAVGLYAVGASFKRLDRDNMLLRLKDERSSLERRIELLGVRPEKCTIDTCAFISDALDAEKQLIAIEKLIKARKDEIEAESKKLYDEIDNIQINHDAAAEYASSITSQYAQAHREKAESVAANKAVAEKIYGRIDGARMAVNAVVAEIDIAIKLRDKHGVMAKMLPDVAAAQAEHDTLSDRLTELNQEISAMAATRSNDMARYQGKITELQLERADLARSITGGKADEVHKKIDASKAHLALRREDFNKMEKAASSLRADEDRMVITAYELDVLMDKKASLEKEASEWMYLANAFGKNGLQALEIDNVAPAISAIANDLLASTYGPAMQVSIDTLNANSRETLDTWVTRDDGSKHLLDDFSGGEKVWILKALRLARTIIGKERSGADIRTAFSDEEDGALRHGETSENFIRMFRAFIGRADIESCYYISHKPECIGMADHVINFKDGSLTVN